MLLAIVFLVSAFAFPNAGAQSTKKTYAYIGATPNPIGVNQETLIHVGITDMHASDAYGWEGLTVTVTKPDGTTQTLGPFRTDSTGGTGTIYVPTTVGTYYLQTHFPEQTTPVAISRISAPAGCVMLASDSSKLALVVTEEQREYWPGVPLPTEYWTRPIDAQLREWAPLGGSWLMSPPNPNLYAPYNDAPETGHILWAKPLTIGGLVGGEFEDYSYHCGDAYEGKWVTRGTPVIMYGILYYNEYPSNYDTQRIRAVDLRTGEDLWSKEDERVAYGRILYYSTMNQHGALAYLWTTSGSTWNAYDATNGDWMYTMTNVPSGSMKFGPNGEILRFYVNTNRGYMYMWNSTAIPELFGSSNYENRYNWYTWRPWGKTVDASGPCPVTPENPLGISGITWNKTIPTGLPGSTIAVLEDRILGGSITSNLVDVWALSLKQGQEGTLLFRKSWTPPAGNLTMAFASASVEDGVFVITARELTAYYGFDINTGEKIWGPTDPEHYLQFFLHTTNIIGYGKLYVTGYGGTVYAYDVKTGELAWNYNVTDHLTEILWSDNWPMYMGFISDGKVYVYQTEHSSINPKPRGAPFICLDAETGELIFSVNLRPSRWGGQPAIGESIIAMYNTYDQRVYAIGKGPSATTVTAPEAGLPMGTSVVIRGTVTDISAGTQEEGLMSRFPNGVPAIADKNMDEWMKYVYLQFPKPQNVEGVQVTIDVVDSNGNYRNIGTAVSDASGMFAMSWIPDIEGDYKVIATFTGSESYWPSSAETFFTVDPAPASMAVTTDTSNTVTMPPIEAYLIGATAAIIIAIAVVGLILYRKRA